MTILFAGGEMGALIPSDATAIEATTSSGGALTWNTSFARCFAQASGAASYLQTPEWAGETDIWVHLDLDQYSSVNTSTMAKSLELLDSNGDPMIRLMTDWQSGGGSATWRLDYWDGAAFQSTSTFTAAPSARQTLDIHVTCDTASGVLDLYLSGTRRIQATPNLSSVNDIASAKGYGRTVAISQEAAYSQIIVADEPTIGWRLTTAPATGAGATTDWTGGYTEIDEIAYSDADFINTATANHVELFAHATTIPAGYSVRGVVVTARAHRSGGPTQMQLALRSSGTTYFGSSQALDAGYGAFVGIWEDDPATSAAFTTGSIAALQFGVKAIA